jgi:two-component system, NtrC family, response regulator AtoC
MEGKTHILIVEDETPLRDLFHKRLSRKGNLVTSFDCAEKALATLDRVTYDVALVDIKLPGMDGIELLKNIKEKNKFTEVIVITGHGTIDSAIAAMKLGAYDYLTKPCKLSELDVVVEKAHEKGLLQEVNTNLNEEIRLKSDYGELVGNSKKMMELKRLIDKMAKADSSVLVEGETGTGKELVAYWVHNRSPRFDKPFIVIHCAALPESLQESELFGYEKGAFTGAYKEKKGLVELANHGTLLIDEVGEINPSLQVKLLRFLETSKFRRLGGGQERQLDIRIMAATNRNLLEDVKKGRFREDLYYRLKVMTLHLPPLRERKDDIPLLVDYFLKKKRVQKGLTAEALRELQRHDWPGNIREFANAIEGAAAMSSGKRIDKEDLPIPSGTDQPSTIKTMDEVEREHISQVLAVCGGNKTSAAKTLGISLRNLYRKIERYGLQ